MSYENKPMKMQWIEVNGRSTPIILPQYWDEEKQDWIVTDENNPLPVKFNEPQNVQLTGSIVEKQIVYNREIRQGTNTKSVDTPDGATSCFVKTRIYSATGSFEENEGLNFWLQFSFSQSAGERFAVLQENNLKSPSNVVMIVDKQADYGDARSFISTLKFIHLPVPPTLRFYYEITGSFGSGEGIDFDTEVVFNFN